MMSFITGCDISVPQESIDYVANATLRLNVLLTCMERTSELSSRFTGIFKILLILLSTKFDDERPTLPKCALNVS